MANLSIPHTRLLSQHIQTPFEDPSDVVSWFGAIQAQYFTGAKWAVGLRTKNQTDATIEHAFNEGRILRTHIMRPTWHFVSPHDIRWMLALTSPRVHTFNGYYYRKSGLDKRIFQKSNEIIKNALQGGKQLHRLELDAELKKARIPTENLGLTYTLLQAELDGIICSGPKIGTQFTYMLLDERVPKTKDMTRDEALGELTKRYFQSHGPAQVQDFAWWSGLTTSDAKKGIEIAKLQKMVRDDKVYWLSRMISENKTSSSAALLPPFDEYFVAYKDRSDILDESYKKHMNFGGGMINGAILLDGIIMGTWKPRIAKKRILITLSPFTKLTNKAYEEVEKAAARYAQFQGLPISLE